MRLDQLGEFALIERIRQLVPAVGAGTLAGIGDDVAVLRGDGDHVWLATCDVQVEGSHFLRNAVNPRDLGTKALAINLSDIAASGGTPRFALVSLGLPGDLETEFVDELYRGLTTEAKRFDVDIVGGNIARSNLGVFIDIFLLGQAPRENVLLRSGAHPGDAIMVTGTLGDAAAGVALLTCAAAKTTFDYAQRARGRYNLPTPRVREGERIGAAHQATSMLDISDGLASDLGHICEASHVGARVYADRMPVSSDNRALAIALYGDEWHFALHGGEDYELLFTAPASAAKSLSENIIRLTGTPASVVGEIQAEEAGRQLILPNGRETPLIATGWDHFKS